MHSTEDYTIDDFRAEIGEHVYDTALSVATGQITPWQGALSVRASKLSGDAETVYRYIVSRGEEPVTSRNVASLLNVQMTRANNLLSHLTGLGLLTVVDREVLRGSGGWLKRYRATA